MAATLTEYRNNHEQIRKKQSELNSKVTDPSSEDKKDQKKKKKKKNGARAYVCLSVYVRVLLIVPPILTLFCDSPHFHPPSLQVGLLKLALMSITRKNCCHSCWRILDWPLPASKRS